MTLYRLGFLAVWLCLAASADANELVLFRASQAGVDAWSWSGARIKAEGDLFKVTENNPDGSYGDVFVADRLPYLKGAVLSFDVVEVRKGAYTVQLVCFKGEEVLGDVNLTASSLDLGPRSFPLSSQPIPAGTETILVKVWAVDEEGATTLLRDLSYTLTYDEAALLKTVDFSASPGFEPHDVLVSQDMAGTKVALKPGASFGSILLPVTLPYEANSVAVFENGEVVNGNTTLQAVFLNDAGEYISSLDLIRAVGKGIHAAPLSSLQLPAGATQYSLKIWLGGSQGAFAVLKRLSILRE